MHNFKQLVIWKKGVDLAVKMYEITREFPKYEQFGLTSQITRSAVSVPSQIAEGAGRRTEREMSRFLNISLGSSYELETQLIIANRVGFLESDIFLEAQTECNELQKMIFTFQRKIDPDYNPQ